MSGLVLQEPVPIDAVGIKFFRIDKLKATPKPIKQLIQGVIVANSIFGMVGAPGTTKTFVGGDMLATISIGNAWFGRKVLQGPAFLLLGEANSRIPRRFCAYEIERKVSLTGAPLFMSNRTTSLLSLAACISIADRIDAACQKYGAPPRMICIDPLSKVIQPGEENSAADMSKLISNIDRAFRRRFGCAVGLVHHTGHGASGRARGSSAFHAALDTEILVSREKSRVVLKCTKQKDLQPFDSIFLEPKIITLPWKDEHGNADTSLALTQSESQSRAVKQDSAMKTLRGLIDKYPKGVSLAAWKGELLEQGLVTGARAFDKLKVKLATKRLLVVSNGIVKLRAE